MIIALEEHVLPSSLSTAGGRLHTVDEARIDVQVLSFLGHPVQQLDPRQAEADSRTANDLPAATVACPADRGKIADSNARRLLGLGS